MKTLQFIFTAVCLVFLLAVTASAATVTSTTTGGNWSAGATWVGGVAPGPADDVVIADGATVTINVTTSCASLQVGQGSSATLEYEATTARTLTVTNDVTIMTLGVFTSAATGTVTTHSLSLGGNLTNNGTLDFSTNGNTAAAGLTFTGATSKTFSGNGAITDIRTITVNKGSSSASILELSTSNFTVQGVTTNVAGFLTLTNGTFKISGSFTGTNRVFTAAGYTIGATTGFWLNNSNYTIAGQNGSLTLDGSLRISSGIYNVGTATGNALRYNSGSSFTMDGGTLNISGRFQGDAAGDTVTFNMSAGTLTVRTQGAAAVNDLAGFDLQATGSSFTMSGGTIVIQDENTAGSAGNQVDYRNQASTSSITGGTVQFGNSTTSGARTFVVAQSAGSNNVFPSLAIDPTQAHTVTLIQPITVRGNVTIGTGTTLNANSLAIAITGNTSPGTLPGNWTNDGTFTPGTQTTTFNGTTNQSIGGSASTTFSTLTIANTGSGNEVVSLAANTTVSAALNINDGVFDQGASSTLTSGLVTVASGATWRNFGIGDVSLSGTPTAVNNNAGGAIRFSANGSPCGDADDIFILSNVSGSPRSWIGTGTFALSDVTVQDQAGTAVIAVQSGTSVSGNGVNWTFVGCTSGTYTWNGDLLGADWQIAANWTPTRTLPAPNDILLINSGFTPIINNVPTQEIAALRITGGTSVTLKTSAANTLTISGQTGIDLQIPATNSLTLADVNPLRINIVSGSSAPVGGQIILQDSGHKLTGNAASAVNFQSNALFTTASTYSSVTNPFGTGGSADGTTNSIQFQNDSLYFHNAGLSPFGTAGSGPVTVFQTGSEAHWLKNEGFQANGRTYADLVIGISTTAVSVSDSGTGDFKVDNLIIESTGSTSSTLTFNGSGASTVILQGNITSNNAGSGSLQDVTLTAGSGGIQINKPGGGTVTYGNFGNTRGIFLQSDTTLASGTTLNLGRLVQMGSSADRTVIANGTIVPNFLSIPGYIVGAVRKPSVPVGSFTFPVGKITGYTPVNLTNATGGGDLTVRPVAINHPSLSSVDSSTLDEYWTLTLNSGTLSTDLTFNYLDSDVDGTEANYKVIRIQGGTIVYFAATALNTGSNTATVTGISGFSDWTLGAPTGPTAVKLSRLNGRRFADGVQLNWESGFEVDNLGYQVYREENGQRTLITPSVIAGSALRVGSSNKMTAGYSYSWFDRQGTANSTYYIEAIDLDGSRESIGPINPYAGPSREKAPGRKRAKTIDELNANAVADSASSNTNAWPTEMRGEETESSISNDAVTVQQTLAGGKALKIQVNRSGWYRVSQPQLAAAGFDTSADARLLQLFVEGREVPISLSTTGPRLSSNDVLEFYGVPLNTPTTDTRTYWLIKGNAPGQRITARKGKTKSDNADATLRSFNVTVERRDKLVYVSNLLNGEEENIFGPLVLNQGVNQTLTTNSPDLTSTLQPQLEVALQGLTEQNHQVELKFNGTTVGFMSFGGRERSVQKFAVDRSLLVDGGNVVSLASLNGPGDISLIDWARVSYAQRYRATNNALTFTAPGGRAVKIENFSSSNVRVIDVTDPNLPELQSTSATAINGGYAITVQVQGAGVRTLLAFTDNTAGQPAALVSNQPSNWNATTNAADMVIITHKDFRNAIDPLANLRRSQGMTVAVVDVEDVYDEFSYGAHTPAALRDFLTLAAGNWQGKPRFVLLVGDSTWDPRNYLGEGANDFVPTKLIDTEFMETASDDWLADFDGGGIAKIAIGRLPVRTAAQASLIVSKILSYEQERDVNAPLRPAVMIADEGFESQSASTSGFLPSSVTINTINRSEIGNDDQTRTQIVDALNQGPMVVNYYGHGSLQVWTGAALFDSNTAANLTNVNRSSLYLMMTCLNGFAHDVYDDSLAESLLKAQNGAVAVWASSGFTRPQPQFVLDQEFHRLLFGTEPLRLGEAARRAKTVVSDQDVRRTWTLLGDPAMRIR